MHCSPGNQWSRRHWHPLPANIATPPVRAVLNSRLKRENETRDCSTAFRQSSQRGWHKKCIDTEPSKRPSPAQGLLAGMVLIYPRLFAGSWITQHGRQSQLLASDPHVEPRPGTPHLPRRRLRAHTDAGSTNTTCAVESSDKAYSNPMQVSTHPTVQDSCHRKTFS